ncbi:thiosulfate sulfurtransferase [Pokkaliibacter plantistimulans]|uniref:Sulfurtransferase n=1 Tax=Proteobacteria bacterium 228 TaxID=2083153 RepID=A0A2S5KJ78_9PROT|nr:sulfurtransferase [Pokkaliibacter plantistimulans]PPC74426.1 thiosulfate sulfurtransferase [Pokkaliibacter plantistimulans]
MSCPVLIEAEALHRQLHAPQLLILDLSSAENYQRGHIPRAIHFPATLLLRGEGPVPNYVASEAQLSERLSAVGMTPDTWVVAYDDQMGPWAGRLLWTLHLLGHRQVSVLNGQLPAWVTAGFDLEQDSHHREATLYTATYVEPVRTTLQDLLNHQHLTVWDARTREEFTGEKVVNASKGGHIPGAIWLEWTDLLQDQQLPRLKPAEELHSLLADRGLTPDKTIVTHCQTHRRSGLTYLAAKALGYPHVHCYDGSWFEWGNHPDTPVINDLSSSGE